jgi:hypothetical protein
MGHRFKVVDNPRFQAERMVESRASITQEQFVRTHLSASTGPATANSALERSAPSQCSFKNIAMVSANRGKPATSNVSTGPSIPSSRSANRAFVAPNIITQWDALDRN